jgi:hypothetical protein
VSLVTGNIDTTVDHGIRVKIMLSDSLSISHHTHISPLILSCGCPLCVDCRFG